MRLMFIWVTYIFQHIVTVALLDSLHLAILLSTGMPIHSSDKNIELGKNLMVFYHIKAALSILTCKEYIIILTTRQFLSCCQVFPKMLTVNCTLIHLQSATLIRLGQKVYYCDCHYECFGCPFHSFHRFLLYRDPKVLNCTVLSVSIVAQCKII